MEKRFITVSEAMKLLSLSRTTIYRFIEQGEIVSYKIGKRRLFEREELTNWAMAHRDERIPPPQVKRPEGRKISKKGGRRKG